MTKNRQTANGLSEQERWKNLVTALLVGILVCVFWFASNFRDVSFTSQPSLGNWAFDWALSDLFGVEWVNGSLNENYWYMIRYHLPIQDAYMASLPNVLIPFGLMLLGVGVLVGLWIGARKP